MQKKNSRYLHIFQVSQDLNRKEVCTQFVTKIFYFNLKLLKLHVRQLKVKKNSSFVSIRNTAFSLKLNNQSKTDRLRLLLGTKLQ